MNDVVHLQRPADGIAVVILEDRTHSNSFSKEMVEWLLQVFRAISEDDSLRAVVVHG